MLEGAGDLVSRFPKWSYPNYNPTYNQLTKSLAPSSRVLGFSFAGVGFRALGFGVAGSRPRLERIGVAGSRLRAGLGLRVSGLGFRVSGLGFRV